MADHIQRMLLLRIPVNISVHMHTAHEVEAFCGRILLDLGGVQQSSTGTGFIYSHKKIMHREISLQGCDFLI